MLDHLIGRPSVAFKRIRVFSLIYLAHKLAIAQSRTKNQWKLFKWINKVSIGKPAWMVSLYTMLAMYLAQHASLLFFLNPPDPLRRMYTRSFFRATWVLTAMDAGFFKAMNIPFKPLRDVLSIVFSLGYLFFPDAAHEQVKKYPPSVQVLRTAWEKSSNPILRLATYPDRGYLPIRNDILISRPTPSSPTSFPSLILPKIKARLYHSKPKSTLATTSKLIFDIHGGGFVCMEPRHHDDYLSQISRVTGHPLVCINYSKAPEHAYPYALEECFDAYRTIMESRGAVLGLNTATPAKALEVVVLGDSAGGNLCAGLVMKIIDWHHATAPALPPPLSVILIYPCLSFEMACWMPTDHMEMLEEDGSRGGDGGVLRVVKSKTDIRLSEPLKSRDAPRTVDVVSGAVDETPSWYKKYTALDGGGGGGGKGIIHSNLSMTSRMTFFNDRILGPEMMRSMALMYLAKSPLKPDVTRDFYLSPILAPEVILAQFPKTFIMCGEKDPLVDDSVVIAARIRHAKKRAHQEWLKLSESDDLKSPLSATHQFALDPNDQIEVKLLPGMSHGFLQFQTVLPEGKQAVKVITKWIQQAFQSSHVLPHPASASEAVVEGRVTSLVLGSLMNEIGESGVLMRRRDSLASKLGF